MGLIYKLVTMNVPGKLIRVIDSFLAQRSFRVKMDGAFSGWRPMLAGVPQGSLLSPLLYNLYTADIPTSIVSELALYADDICIYDQTKKPKYAYLSVQHHLNDIGRWASRSRIKININKSNAITFSRKKSIDVPKLMLDNEHIDYVQECRYLGVHLHRRLNWNGHCRAMRTKALDTLGQLTPLLQSSLPQKSKLLLYKSYVRPQMTYASPAWAFIKKSQYKSLQVVENRALRIIGGYDIRTRTTKMHFDLEIPMLKALLKL